MTNILLFSQLTTNNRQAILSILFPKENKGKTFAYMPSGGVKGAEIYIAEWEAIANERSAQFSVIDNTSGDAQEKEKLLSADVLLISGGNTFQLLNNLRNSGLDKVILQISRKPDVTIAGFSAGAIVLTPTITICNLPDLDPNLIGLDDLHGLNIIDFEVFPHYNKHTHESILINYQKNTNHIVREIAEDDFIFLRDPHYNRT